MRKRHVARRLRSAKLCRLVLGTSTEVVDAPSRWAGGGLAGQLQWPDTASQSEESIVTLRPDMKVGDVIRALLASSAICAYRGKEEVFYVRVAGSEIVPPGDGCFCISLEDLLEAPRHLPLDCLIGTREDQEECALYDFAPEPYADRSIQAEMTGRLPWLVGLLAFLTVSSAILEYYDDLLHRHLVIAFYLTALVGCGGNSGSQASALVLQAMATGELAPTTEDLFRVCKKEIPISLGVALVLSLGVAARIVLFGGAWSDALLISLAMAVTVVFSVVFGALAPLALQRAGTDPAKVSGPLLSTVVDIMGVLVACLSAAALEAAGVWH